MRIKNSIFNKKINSDVFYSLSVKNISFLSFLFSLSLLLALLPVSLVADVNGTGAWNGQDLNFVPVSWSIVEGSPAEANPNIQIEGSSTVDTTTDALIWRRHERPTDNIYIPQAGISFRSAINNAWTTIDFPIIIDPDTSVATQGDVTNGNSATGVASAEMIDLLVDHWDEWDTMGRAGIGIDAINVGLFHNAAGSYSSTLGWGGCTVNTATNVCDTPYNGVVWVVDNFYLYPTVTNRQFPDGTGPFSLVDPLDQLVGHEFGHALGLPHRSVTTELMNPFIFDNDGDGRVDNTNMNTNEINTVRASSLVVPGVTIDPPGEFFNGSIVSMRKPSFRNGDILPEYLDLSSVRASLDLETELVFIDLSLFGIIPNSTDEINFWLLFDSDDNINTGGDQLKLNTINVPTTSMNGVDYAIRTTVKNQQIQGYEIWEYVQGDYATVSVSIKVFLNVFRIDPYYDPGLVTEEEKQYLIQTDLFNVIKFDMPNSFFNFKEGDDFILQSITQGLNKTDKLDVSLEEPGTRFNFDHSNFPLCYPKGDGTHEGTVDVEFIGLKPNLGYHALIGPNPVMTGNANNTGGGIVQIPISGSTSTGLHLITIGTDNSALTADCIINVVETTTSSIELFYIFSVFLPIAIFGINRKKK